ALLGGKAKRLADERGNALAVDHLVRALSDRTQHIDGIYDLKATLLAFLDRLLPGDEHQRHSTKLSESSRSHEVGGTGTKRRKTDAGLAREPTVGGSHEAGTLLVTGNDDLDLGVA